MEVFAVGDIVWAKSSVGKEIFWPAKVIEPDKDLTRPYGKKPVIVFVGFIAENTCEAIVNPSKVQHFDCEGKDKLIRKGRGLKNQGRRLQFESALIQAEKSKDMSGKRILNTPKKYPLDTKEEARRSLPRIRKSDLFDQEKHSLRINSDSKVTKCSLETVFEESSDNVTSNVSTSMKRNVMDKVKGKMAKKRNGISKAAKPKDKMALKKTDNLKQNGKAKQNQGKNTLETETLGGESDINEGFCPNSSNGESILAVSSPKSLKRKKDCKERKNKRVTTKKSLARYETVTTRRTRSNSLNEPSTSRTSVKRTRNCYSESETNATGQSSLATESPVGKKILRPGQKSDLNESEQSQTARFKSSGKVRRKPKNSSSKTKKTKSNKASATSRKETWNTRSKDKIKTVSAARSEVNKLEAIPEERESEIDDIDETRITHRRIRLEKRRWNKVKNSKSLGKDAQGTKRLRLASLEEEAQNTDSRKVEVEEPFSNDNLGFKTQISSLQLDLSESLSETNNIEKTKLKNATSKTKQASKAVDTCLASLNGDSCGNTDSEDKLRNSASEGLQTTEEGFGKEKLENVVEKEDSIDIDGEGNINEDESSDDESLPEAFSLSPVLKKYFLPGDVVWVKHTRFPFWPGQIQRAHRKRKTHYYVRFLPKSDCKCIKIHKKNIKSFTGDHETHEQFKHQEMNPGLQKEFEEAVKQAEDILMRRVFQKDDFLLDEIEDQASEVSDDDDERSSPSNMELDKPVDEVDKLVGEADEKPEDGESECDSSDMEIENRASAGNGRSQRQRKPVSRYSNILNEIHQCKQRLLDIYREKVVSFRHKTFKYGTVKEKNNLKHMASFGPIQDDKTVEEIVMKLKTWYDEEQKEASITLDYIYDVWLPEAIIHYIQITDNLSAGEAENLYLDHTRHVDKLDVEETKIWLKKQTIDEATMQETVERARQKLYNIISS